VATEARVERGRRGFFLFDFREHEKDLLALRTPEPEVVRAVSSWDWELKGTGGPDESPYLFFDDENDLTTVEALRAHVDDQIPWPDAAVQVVFDKLRALMEQSAWRFVGGAYWEYEGNRHNTTIGVTLEKS
jgi:hypothetical protein